MQTRKNNVIRYTKIGALLGTCLVYPFAQAVEYDGVSNAYTYDKERDLAEENGCIFIKGTNNPMIDNPVYLLPTVHCASQNVTDWIIDTAKSYGTSCARSTLKFAVPALLASSVVIGAGVGALYGFCKKPESSIAQVEVLPNAGINTEQVQMPLLEADTLNDVNVVDMSSSSSGSVYARDTLFSQAQAKQEIQARTTDTTTLQRPKSPSAMNRVV